LFLEIDKEKRTQWGHPMFHEDWIRPKIKNLIFQTISGRIKKTTGSEGCPSETAVQSELKNQYIEVPLPMSWWEGH